MGSDCLLPACPESYPDGDQVKLAWETNFQHVLLFLANALEEGVKTS